MISIERICKTCGNHYLYKFKGTLDEPLCKFCSKSIMAKKLLTQNTLPQLRKKATRMFNRYIRYRDQIDDYSFRCITCGKIKVIEGASYHACHLFPAGHYPAISYDEDNVHGGCQACNYYRHGVGHEYADKVRKKVGEERYEKLLVRKDYYKRHPWKWDKFYLVDVIESYTKKYEELKSQRDFKFNGGFRTLPKEE